MKKLNDEQIFHKYIIDSETYFFSKIWKDPDDCFCLRKDISMALDTHINDVVIIGSGKTGFSLKPGNVGRKFDGLYKQTRKQKDKSDIDIAIVSPTLFEQLSKLLFSFTKQYKDGWDTNVYYKSGKDTFGVTLNYKFVEYLARGWFRPDLLPTSFVMKEVQAEKEKWRKIFDRKVSFGIYKDWHYFKYYHLASIQEFRSKIETGEVT